MPLVQEARRGSSLKIVAAVLGGLLCADLVARIPLGATNEGSDPAARESAANFASRTETTGTSAPAPSPQVAAAPVAAPAPEPARSAAPEPKVTPPSAAAPAPAAPAPEQQAQASAAEADNNQADGVLCEQQTWPYLEGRCKEAAAASATSANRQVRVIGKESTAPAVVVTPLPPETAGPRRNAVTTPGTQANQPGGDQMTLAAAPTEAKPEQADAAPMSANVSMPRPAPESIRPPAEQAVTPQPVLRNSATAPERSARRESPIRERASVAKTQKSEKQQKPEKQRFTRSQPPTEQEPQSVERRAGIAESRAYQLPSGRRIVVFRQSNGEIGIVPDRRGGGGGDGGSFFFGW